MLKMFNQQFVIIILLVYFKSISSQQQCLQLQNCIDLALKSASEMMQQYPVASGSYNAISVHSGSVQCRSLRTNFECMINYSPYCLRNEMTRNLPQYISQSKQLLDVNCDQGTSWSNTQCYRKPEITQNCETMIPELNMGSYNYYSASIPRYICEKYQRFRHCVYNVVLNHCTPLERETFFSYLYDKVQEISWKCANESVFFDNYDRYHPIYNNQNGVFTNLAQPPYTYGTSRGILNPNINSNINPNIYPQPLSPTNRFNYDRGGYYDANMRYGSGYPTYPGSDYYSAYDESNCLEKTRYASRQCEEIYLQNQRDARNQRTSVDLQRKICCSLYSYRNCLAAAVVKNCRDSSQSVVDILMGEARRRELTIGCREYSFDYCNSSFSKSLSNLLILFLIFLQFTKFTKFN